jgi:molybdopterin-guanine dinucleotide biosynthesis protein A
MKYDMPAVLFAGGKSSRMGEDKSLLPFAGYNTLSQYQYQRLKKRFKEVYLSAKENKFDFDPAVITDHYTQSSPLVGLLSIFETLHCNEIFVLSVDAPFVDKEVIESLLHQDKKFDAVIAKSPHGTEPLCGIYRRSIVPLAKTHLEAEDYRMTHLLSVAHTRFISFEDDAPFMNLNHPHEYKEALKIISI